MKVFYSEDYTAAADAFDTTRKSGWIAASLASDPIEGVEVVAPIPLSFDDVASVHDAEYVKAVQSGEPRGLAQSQNFSWDPGMWRMVTASNGGVVAAARAAVTDGVAGSLSSGLHHARAERGASLCTFNGLVIAAKAMLDEGVESVLILDLDAHCGGGTHAMIRDDARIRQVDVAVSAIDRYEATGCNSLDIVRLAGEYLGTLEQRLAGLDRDGWVPGLCLYNAGMDPEERCLLGGLDGITAEMLSERERMVFEWAQGRGVPAAFVLAGGYFGGDLSEGDVTGLHRLTIRAASRIEREVRDIR